MNAQFLSTLQAELSKHPQLKKLDDAHLAAIAEAFDGWAEIAAYEPGDLVAMFAEEPNANLTEGQARALIVKAKAESLSSKVEVQVSATTAVAPAEPPNPWANLLTANSSLGFDADAIMATRINPKMAPIIAQGGGLLVLLGLGLDQIFDEGFFEKIQIDDPTLGRRIYEFNKKRRAGEYFTEADFRRMLEKVPSWFGPEWDTVMMTVAQMAGANRASELIKGAEFSSNQIAPALAALDVSMPAVAENLSVIAKRTDLIYVAQDGVAMMRDLMAIAKDSTLHAFAGIVNPPSPDAGMVMLLQKFASAKTATYVSQALRLSVVVERIILGAFACPQSPLPAEYVRVMATLAAQYAALKAVVMPETEEEENPRVADSFRGRSMVVPPATVVKHQRFTFTLGFKISFNFARQ